MSVNIYNSATGELSAVAGNVQMDSTPTQNSTNAVTSNGIYHAIQSSGTGTDNYLTAYIVGSTPLAVDWLSATAGGAALVPKKGIFYLIATAGDYNKKLYAWDNDNSVYYAVSSAVTPEIMVGATSEANGAAGYVPQPLIADRDKALFGDGTFRTVSVNVMTGATAEVNGASGTVPQPLAGDQNKALFGDGTYKTINMNVMAGATNEADGASGLVPKPFIADKNKALFGDGTYHSVPTGPFAGATQASNGSMGLVPAPTIEDRSRALFGDGAYHDIYTSAAGSTILVTTTESAFYGRTVTVTDGRTTLTDTIGNDGDCLFTDVVMYGAVNVTATDADGNVGKSTLNMSYFGTYIAPLTSNYAVLQVTTSDSRLYGRTINVYKGDQLAASTTFSNQGTASVAITETGLYYVKVTYENKVITESVNITALKLTYTVDFKVALIYGVLWDGTSTTAFSRTDRSETFIDPSPAIANGNGSSPFDDIWPWSGIEEVEDEVAGTLVKIPKFWYKWTIDGASMKLQISDDAERDFLVSPAHADRGDGVGERDYVYVGKYHCVDDYTSTTGALPTGSKTRATFREGIHNLGSDIYQWDFSMWWTICMLYLVEFANWNSQTKIGYGCGNGSSVVNNGSTDAMVYHTGTDASSRTTYGHTQYRHIEGLWDNVTDWCDGIYFSGSNVFCVNNPNNFSDSSGGTNVGTRATSTGYIKAWNVPSASGFEYALYPNLVGGSDSTYVPDYCNSGSSGVVLRVGGDYYQYQYFGLFYLVGDEGASTTRNHTSSRLMKLPANAS